MDAQPPAAQVAGPLRRHRPARPGLSRPPRINCPGKRTPQVGPTVRGPRVSRSLQVYGQLIQ